MAEFLDLLAGKTCPEGDYLVVQHGDLRLLMRLSEGPAEPDGRDTSASWWLLPQVGA